MQLIKDLHEVHLEGWQTVQTVFWPIVIQTLDLLNNLMNNMFDSHAHWG